MPEIERSGSNPLQKYFRQPKIYIGLPSKGNWYPDGSIEKTETTSIRKALNHGKLYKTNVDTTSLEN